MRVDLERHEAEAREPVGPHDRHVVRVADRRARDVRARAAADVEQQARVHARAHEREERGVRLQRLEELERVAAADEDRGGRAHGGALRRVRLELVDRAQRDAHPSKPRARLLRIRVEVGLRPRDEEHVPSSAESIAQKVGQVGLDVVEVLEAEELGV